MDKIIHPERKIVLSNLPIEELQECITEAVKSGFENYLNKATQASEKTDFLTRKEAAKLLSISLPTLALWTKTGKVKGYRIASRVRYKRNELEASLNQIKLGTLKNQ